MIKYFDGSTNEDVNVVKDILQTKKDIKELNDNAEHAIENLMLSMEAVITQVEDVNSKVESLEGGKKLYQHNLRAYDGDEKNYIVIPFISTISKQIGLNDPILDHYALLPASGVIYLEENHPVLVYECSSLNPSSDSYSLTCQVRYIDILNNYTKGEKYFTFRFGSDFVRELQ